MRRPLEIEWRIPWDASMTLETKNRAAKKLLDYLTQGTFFDTTTRMRVTKSQIVQMNPTDDPYIILTLE